MASGEFFASSAPVISACGTSGNSGMNLEPLLNTAETWV